MSIDRRLTFGQLSGLTGIYKGLHIVARTHKMYNHITTQLCNRGSWAKGCFSELESFLLFDIPVIATMEHKSPQQYTLATRPIRFHWVSAIQKETLVS